MELEAKIEEVEVYTVAGKKFLDKEEAESYQREIRERLQYTYYRVSYNPDLTEGRGYYDRKIVAVPSSSPNNAIYQYLVENHGSPIEMVMGVSPINNWDISKPFKYNEIDILNDFLNLSVPIGIGSTKKNIKLPVVYIDERGKVVFE